MSSTTPSAGRIVYVIVALGVLALRWPFLDAGYGNDPDAWAVAKAAREIADDHHYVASRLPGNPLHELTCAIFFRGGPQALNGLSALMSALAAVSLMGVMRRLNVRDSVLAAMGFALTPVVFIAGVSCIDYVWAAALILAGTWASLARRPVIAGLCLGLATGCRITSLLMLPTFAWLLWSRWDAGRRMRPVLLCLAVAGVVSVLAYVPVYGQYGWGFLTFVAPPQAPHITTIVSRGLLRVWGPVGLMALAAAVLARCLCRPAPGDVAMPESGRRLMLPPAILAMAAFGAAFVRLPLEEGYLLPAVPFAILVAAALLSRRWFRGVCIALCLSPWLCAVGRPLPGPWTEYSRRAVHFRVGASEWVVDVFRGPVLRDHADRMAGMRYVDQFVAGAGLLPERAVIVVGFWKPQLDVRFADDPALLGRMRFVLDSRELARVKAEGRPVYFLPEMRDFNLAACGEDLAAVGRPLIVTPPSK